MKPKNTICLWFDSEAFSFQIATENQEETDRYWNAIVGNGGIESACGWCKDRWGISWQITPRANRCGGDKAKRAFEAMTTMKKIDIDAIEVDVNEPARRCITHSYNSLRSVQPSIRSLVAACGNTWHNTWEQDLFLPPGTMQRSPDD